MKDQLTHTSEHHSTQRMYTVRHELCRNIGDPATYLRTPV